MSSPRLDLLKTLGDNTRYAIYLELARSAAPLATADIARSLDLHVNTVRPHLERMRDVGLLEVHSAPLGGVGRPQHRYTLAADAPSLGLEPPLFPMLARLLLKLAAESGADAEDAVDAAREQGRHDAGRTLAVGTNRHADRPCLMALVTYLDTLGFDPQVVTEGDAETGTESRATVGFAHCPFAELAASNPDLVCSLHRGMVEGFVDAYPEGEVVAFRTLVDRDACQVDLVGGSA